MASYRRSRRRSSLTRVMLIAALALLGGFVLLQTSPALRGIGADIRAASDDFIARNAQPENNVVARLKGMWSAHARVEELEAEIRELSIWKDTAIAMSERMERYEELLNLTGEPAVVGASARVVAEVNGPFSESRLANAGRLQGVEDGSVALNTKGLVGRVVRVGETSSRILLVTDFNSRVPVAGQISGVRAILAGGRGGYGRLIDKPEDDPFVNGELLLTTGEGGLFPPGLRVGEALYFGDQWVADLAVHEGAINFVRLLPPVDISQPDLELPEPDLNSLAEGTDAETSATASLQGEPPL